MDTPSRTVARVGEVVGVTTLFFLAGVVNNFSEDVTTPSTPNHNSQVYVSMLLNSETTYEESEECTDTKEVSNASWDDLRPLAKELTGYVGANGHGYTSYHGGFDAHPGCNGYDCSISKEITISVSDE